MPESEKEGPSIHEVAVEPPPPTAPTDILRIAIIRYGSQASAASPSRQAKQAAAMASGGGISDFKKKQEESKARQAGTLAPEVDVERCVFWWMDG